MQKPETPTEITIQAAKSEWDADRKALADKHPDWAMPAWSRAPAWRRRPYMLSAMEAADGKA